MSLPPTNGTADVPLDPFGVLPKLPSLNNSLGAFIIGTYISLMLYGLTLHQSYRYFRLFPKDLLLMRIIVVATLILETVHTALCMHTCYYYLVVNYSNPAALLEGVWSIRLMPLLTALPVLILLFVGFAAAATAEAFIRPTFADYNKVERQ
ncbi:hypothetical protein NUW54_g4494 [Trametes sanguinea]|uniref:Uncharacterized protein n=1 Tax=Trametes sanguinea TaxID=158606 RepID=A0ACC1PXT6_9APHY|nr:hypothetical protein NUW54_g4494 [Trametes sanguinea]